MFDARRGIVAAMATAALVVSSGVEAGAADAAKRKPRVSAVSVDARSSLNLLPYAAASGTPGVTNSTGMNFSGRVTFKKVHLDHPSRARLTKTIKTKARRTCVRLFAKGGNGWIPKVQVWTHTGPIPATPGVSPYPSLATSDSRDTSVSGAGSSTILWSERSTRLASYTRNETTYYGISPGQDIVAEGGWWDPIRGHLRENSSSFKLKQRGKKTEITVTCVRFTATTQWKP